MRNGLSKKIAKLKFRAYESLAAENKMSQKSKSSTIARHKPIRGKLNLTIHPEIKDFAVELASVRRDTLSQLFEDLVEAEWNRVNGIYSVYPPPKSYLISPTVPSQSTGS